MTVSNAGAVAVTITAISITGTNPGDFSQTNNCGKSLNGNSSCTINVTFKPTATGTRSASVTLTDTGGGSRRACPYQERGRKGAGAGRPLIFLKLIPPQ